MWENVYDHSQPTTQSGNGASEARPASEKADHHQVVEDLLRYWDVASIEGVCGPDHEPHERTGEPVPLAGAFGRHVWVAEQFRVDGEKIVVGAAHLELAAIEGLHGRHVVVTCARRLLVDDANPPQTQAITQFDVFPAVRVECGVEWFLAEDFAVDRDV